MHRAAWALLMLHLASTGVALAGSVTPGEGDTLGWHVAREGDTLEKITERYLGTTVLWQENWRLNPGIKDPNRLSIGQRIRVILKREIEARSADVLALERRVEKKPYPEEWVSASIGDKLKEKDGLRTYRRSSAELGFDDGTHLTLTEDSFVFLKEMASSVTRRKRQALGIVEGQTDIVAGPRRAPSSDIEILVGGVISRPSSSETEGMKGRARRAPDGGAELMVYGGTSEVEAKGARIAVTSGMGTKVPKDGPPRPPERLLSAPHLEAPASGSSQAYANPRFSWGPVAGAASYTVEVCRDASCSLLVERGTKLPDTAFTPQALPAGALYWRVTATSASGLDGFPSEPWALSVSGVADLEPPVVAVGLEGEGRVLDAARVLIGSEARLVLSAHDDASGVAETRYRWDGGAWLVAADGAITPPSGTPHDLEVIAVDGIGRSSRPLVIRVERPDRSLAPPVVEAE
jgi:hypothetical protein